MTKHFSIDALVDDLKPVRPRRASRDVAMLVGLGAAELALFLAAGQLRPDMALAMSGPVFWWKLGFTAALAIGGVVTAVAAFAPEAPPRHGLSILVALALATCALGWLFNDPARDAMPMAMRLDWHSGIDCLTSMLELSLPPAIMLAAMMRRGAATRPGATALAAGLAAAGIGAFVFVFHCPYDDPLYVIAWYGLNVAIAAGVARLALPRFARW